jgi:copper chaperone NosL
MKITLRSKIILIFAGLLFFIALPFPMWQIQLDAPQYPEGLALKLFANKIDGDVDIINGLNHYIGMKTLHTEDFIEFKVLPYILIFFGIFTLFTALYARRKWVIGLMISLFLFVALAGIDFYRWNYQYGHNLNPDAAIQVPGMAYQPPVLGYKQLLNFGAYSIPDLGGWLLISAGALIFLVVVIETKFLHRIFKKKSARNVTAILMLAFTFTSCSDSGAQPITIHKDKCDHCQMTISNGRFSAEVITKKGRVYKFDDLFCMTNYVNENGKYKFKAFYVDDYTKTSELINATTAFYVKSETLNSPMNGNVAAFLQEQDAKDFAKESNSSVTNWTSIINK